MTCEHVLPNGELDDAAVRELLKETGMTLTVDDSTWWRGSAIRVPLPDNKTQHVYVCVACVHVPFVTPNTRTSAKVEQVCTLFLECAK
jgi:8-oxo-dGTP pyrophosphatase MutT (NUDIX family)